MESKRSLFLLVTVVLAAIGLLVLLLYVRERLFTGTEPIILAD